MLHYLGLLLVASSLLAQYPPPGDANANKLQGRDICPETPTSAQSLTWDVSKNCWTPATVEGGEGGHTQNTDTGTDSTSFCVATNVCISNATGKLRVVDGNGDPITVEADAFETLNTGATALGLKKGTAPAAPTTTDATLYLDTADNVVKWILAGAGGIITPVTLGNGETTIAPAKLPLVTTVGSPGSDSSIPTEQAVREAISGLTGFDPLDATEVWLREEFPTQRVDADPSGLYKWLRVGTGSQIAGVANHYGIAQFASGTSANDMAGVAMTYSSTRMFDRLDASSSFASGWATVFVGMIDQQAGVVAVKDNNVGFCFGFANVTSACLQTSSVNTGIAVVADSGTPITCTTGSWNASNFNLVAVADATHATCADTGVAANTATWYNIKISSSTLGTVTCTIDGVACSGSVSTNLPTGAMHPLMMTVTRTTAAKWLWADFWAFRGRGLSR